MIGQEGKGGEGKRREKIYRDRVRGGGKRGKRYI